MPAWVWRDVRKIYIFFHARRHDHAVDTPSTHAQSHTRGEREAGGSCKRALMISLAVGADGSTPEPAAITPEPAAIGHSKAGAGAGCYTEKAPNAWHCRGTQKTGNTYNQPNRPNRHTPQTKHQALPKGQGVAPGQKQNQTAGGAKSSGRMTMSVCMYVCMYSMGGCGAVELRERDYSGVLTTSR